jgi:hypothetical protein
VEYDRFFGILMSIASNKGLVECHQNEVGPRSRPSVRIKDTCDRMKNCELRESHNTLEEVNSIGESFANQTSVQPRETARDSQGDHRWRATMPTRMSGCCKLSTSKVPNIAPYRDCAARPT